MYPNRTRNRLAPAYALFASLSLAGCIAGGKDDAPAGSEVENEVVGATIHLAGGAPAIGAVVRVYPVDHSPQAAPKVSASQALVFSTRTDSKGRYVIDSLPRGEYNILSSLDGDLAFQDSVFISGRTGTFASDTLGEPGSLSGRIEMQQDDDPRSVTVQLLGTNAFVNVDDSGRFSLEDLAEGVYRAKIVTTEENYTPLFRDLRIRAGEKDTLVQPLVLTYTGIPIVENLSVAYDTLTGLAKLRWEPVRYAAFEEYLVFRSNAGELDPVPVMIARTLDTTFVDTVFPDPLPPAWSFPDWEELPPSSNPMSTTLEYRVAVRNKSLEVGKTYGSARTAVVNPLMVRTQMEFEKLGVIDNVASIGDTVTFRVSYANPLRANVLIQWYVAGIDLPVREFRLDGLSGDDMLRFRWDAVSRPVVHAVIRDAAGVEWRDSTYLYIIAPVPAVDAGKEQVVSIRDTVRLLGKAQDKFGEIVKWEWDIGRTGSFTSADGPEFRFVAPDTAGRIPCVFKATNEDGISGSSDVWIEVVRGEPSVVTQEQSGVFHGDSLYLTGTANDPYGRIVSYEWDIGASGDFVRTSRADTAISFAGTGTERFVLRVTDDDGHQAMDSVWASPVAEPVFVPIPSGSLPNEGNRIKVAAFRMQTTEVTRGQFSALMRRMPLSDKGGTLDLPVLFVTLGEVLEYCNKLGARFGLKKSYDIYASSIVEIPGNGVRLPTASQWEYAARAGDEGTYWETVTGDSLNAYTWYAGNSSGRAHPVALKKPNGFGLFDMNGNASEFVFWEAYLNFWSMGSSWNSDYQRRVAQLRRFLNGGYWTGDEGATEEVGFRVILPQ